MTVTTPRGMGGVRALLAERGLPAGDLGGAPETDVRTAEADGALVGVVAVETWGADGLLRSLAVAEGARGGGVGRRLVDAAEMVGRSRSLGALYLLTTTAEPFFLRLGYCPTDRAGVPEAVRQSSEFASVCPASAACLSKRLA